MKPWESQKYVNSNELLAFLERQSGMIVDSQGREDTDGVALINFGRRMVLEALKDLIHNGEERLDAIAHEFGLKRWW